jgi:uncharacterized protein (TIGR00725 family)
MKFFLNLDTNILYDDDNRVFDLMARRWRRAVPAAMGGKQITVQDACRWLQRQADHPVRAPIAVIGPSDASPSQIEKAEGLGSGIAKLGLALLCDGRAGVATAAAKGAQDAGGSVLGIFPEADWRDANPYVTFSLAIGPGSAPYAAIVNASLCVLAVGGGYDTLCGIAHAKHIDRKVFTTDGAPTVEDIPAIDSTEETLDAISNVVLNTDGAEPTWR